VKFLVDNQLPPALARFISENLGVEAVHVTDIGLRNETDSDIWQYASEKGLVVISKDDDFVTLYSKAPAARLLWVRLGNCRRASRNRARRRGSEVHPLPEGSGEIAMKHGQELQVSRRRFREFLGALDR
jgi:predicted nuclease of predicted toxin-antitoxin system